MFQVLLFPIEALVKDFEMLECHRWEAIIVDECQRTGVSKHFEQIKMLTTEVRVLLSIGQLKDSIPGHLNLLSLLDSRSDFDSSNGLKTDLNDDLGKLRDRLSQFIACDCKSDSSGFLEYWVPVLISNVQLEQYCAYLLSNSISLRSGSKNDPVGALRDILISTRKCCDHPYIVDPSLQGFLTKGLPEFEYLDVGIKASGKLQLLDTILSKVKNRGLRVVILFQSIGGSGRDSIGDILDDFLRQRFGPDSYERVDGGMLPLKKHAALNKFNDTDSGRFVFLIENRACLPSVKLSSVDTIIIFDSDWNPANDLKALQRLSIDSSFEQIKIFRLYSSCTVEEKVLVLATHNVTFDSSLQSISQTAIHMLLMWGASYLFSKLDDFHGANISAASANISSVPSLLNDVAQEFLALLSPGGANTYTNNSLIINVHHGGGTYSKNVSLLGELKVQLTDGEEPHGFWTKLLEGRNPRWRYSIGPSQKTRKRVQYVEDSPKKPEVETDDVGKKRKKAVNNCADPASLRPRLKEGELPGDREVHMVETEEGIGLCDLQKSHVLLKPEISKLCEILQFPEEVKLMGGRFLKYVIYNHHVNREPTTILQAFQMSLCWIVASLLKYKIDKKESLSLAKKHLNFDCTEEEVNSVYSKLRLLKKMFVHHVENFKEPESSKDSVSAADIMKELPDARISQSVAFREQNVEGVIEERSENQEFAEDRLLLQQEQAPKDKTGEKEISRSNKHIQKKCQNRMTKLITKQLEEIQELNRIWEEKRVQLEKQHRLESALVCSIHSNIPVRLDKLKRLDDEFVKKMYEYNCQKEISFKDLQTKLLAERNEEKQNAAHCMEELNSAQAELSVVTPARADVSLQSLALRDECSASSTSTGNLYILQQVEVPPLDANDTGPNDQTNHKALVTEHAEQLQLSPPTDSTLDHNQPNLGSASGVQQQPHSERHITSSNVEAPQQFEDPSEPSNQAILEHGANLAPRPLINSIDASASGNQNVLQQVEFPPLHPTDAGPSDPNNHEAVVIEHAKQLQLSPPTDSPVDLHQPNSGSASGEEQQSCSEEHITSLNVEPAQQFQDQSEPSSQAVLQHGENLAPCPPINAINTPASGNQNVLQQVKVPPLHLTDARPIDQNNHKAVVIEHAKQLQLSSSRDSPVDQNQPNSGSASGVEQQSHSEGHITCLNVEATQQFENLVDPSNQAVLQPGADLAPPPQIRAIDAPASGIQNVMQEVEVPSLHPNNAGPTDQTYHKAVVIEHAKHMQLSPLNESPVDQNEPNSGSASGVEQPPRSEGRITSLNAAAPQQFKDPADPSDRALLLTGANLGPPTPQIHAIDSPASGNQNGVQQVELPPLHPTDAGPSDQNNHEAVVIGHAKQLQLSPSTDSPVDQNQPNSGSASGFEQPHSEGHITSLNVEAQQKFVDPSELSNQADLQPWANLVPPPQVRAIDASAVGNQNGLQQVEVPPLHCTDAAPTDQINLEAVVIEHAEQLQLSLSTDSPVDQNQPNSGSASGFEKPHSEGHITSLNAEAPQQFEDPAEPLNQAVLQPWANLAPPPQIHAIDVPAIRNQNVLQQIEGPPLHPTDAGPTDQTNHEATDQTYHEAVVIEHAEQLQLSPSTDSPVDQNQPNSASASGVEQPLSEGHITSLNAEAPQQFEDPAEPSNQAVLQPGADMAPPLPIHASDVPLGQNQPDLHLAVRNDQQPSSEGCVSFQNAEASLQLVEDMAGHPNHVPGTQLGIHPPQLVEDMARHPNHVPGPQLGIHPPIDTIGEFGALPPLHSEHQAASQMPTQRLYADPLQNELERLHKETEQAIKVYEDMKLRLKSDCMKEMEEIIAEIRRRYQAEFQGAEAAFLLKKKELDTNYNKVLMNKILAEAFRSKYLDLRPSGALGMQQVVPSEFMQQVHLPSSVPAPTPSHVTGSSSAVPAVASQQTIPRHPQVVHYSSVLFSSMPTRPPHIVFTTPPTGNCLVSSEIRGPAPHLQPFRPSSSMSATSIASLPRGLPSQQAPRNLSATSPSVSLVPPRPTYYSGHYERAPQPEATGGLPTLENSSLSALGLLVDKVAHPPNILPGLPDSGPIFGSLDLSQFGTPVSERVNLAPSDLATDIVLLDDD